MGVEVTVTPSKAKKVIWILLILIILGGGAFALWKFGVIDKVFHKTPPVTNTQGTQTPTTTPPPQTPSTDTPTPSTETSDETKTPIEEAPQEALPEVTGDGTISLEIGNVEFESKTIQPRTTTTTKNGTNTTTTSGTTTTKYKIASVTLSITNRQADAITLKGELVVLDIKGNNAVSNNFIYKTFEIGDVGAGETYNRKLPVNTVGDVRPFLTNVAKGDSVTIQITLKDTNEKVVKTSKKNAVVG